MHAETCLHAQRRNFMIEELYNMPANTIQPLVNTNQRFSQAHIDILAPLPPSQGHFYYLIMIDRLSLPGSHSDTRSNSWDCGKRLLHQLDSAIWSFRDRDNRSRQEIRVYALQLFLPTVLLGLRTIFKPSIGGSCAEPLYGTTLRLPGEFFDDNNLSFDAQELIHKLQEHMRDIHPLPINPHAKKTPFAHKILVACSHVFVRADAVQKSLVQPYTGPHRVVRQLSPILFQVEINGKYINISTERLKPAFVVSKEVASI